MTYTKFGNIRSFSSEKPIFRINRFLVENLLFWPDFWKFCMGGALKWISNNFKLFHISFFGKKIRCRKFHADRVWFLALKIKVRNFRIILKVKNHTWANAIGWKLFIFVIFVQFYGWQAVIMVKTRNMHDLKVKNHIWTIIWSFRAFGTHAFLWCSPFFTWILYVKQFLRWIDAKIPNLVVRKPTQHRKIHKIAFFCDFSVHWLVLFVTKWHSN